MHLSRSHVQNDGLAVNHKSLRMEAERGCLPRIEPCGDDRRIVVVPYLDDCLLVLQSGDLVLSLSDLRVFFTSSMRVWMSTS